MRFKNLLFIFCSLIITTVSAQKYSSRSTTTAASEWNGVSFSSEKTFHENISESPKLSFISKVASEDELIAVLAKEEMVTIFAPMDIAFTNLSKKQLDSLLSDTQKLSSMVKFLTIPGRVDFNSLTRAIEKNGGTAHFITLSGEKIGVKMIDGRVTLFDSKNNISTIAASNFYHKNGFFHIVNGLIFPSEEKK